MRAEVVLQRLEKVRAQMREHKVDALLIPKEEESRSVDVPYLSGFKGSLALLIVTLNKAALIVDPRYIEQARQEIHGLDVVKRIRGEQIFKELIPKALGDAKRVGLMKGQLLPFEFYLDLLEHFPNIEIVPLPDIARTGRIVKDEEEIRRIKLSIRATERALRHSFSVIQPGVTELAIAEAFKSALPKGAELAFPSIVLSGRRSILPHGRPSKRRIKKGDVVQLDVGCILRGDDGEYVSDVSRPAICGTANAEQKRMDCALVETIYESLKLYMPGVKACAAHARADEVLESHGYGKLIHSLGHGIGLETHEKPRVSPVNAKFDDAFEVGNVVTIEPGIYSKKLGFGMRIELDVRITPDGHEILDRLPWRQLVETDKL